MASDRMGYRKFDSLDAKVGWNVDKPGGSQNTENDDVSQSVTAIESMLQRP